MTATLERALQNPYVKAFLDTIAYSEGADYRTLVFGGKNNQRIKDFSTHPANKGFRATANIKGRAVTSTAAGRYQFLKRTWNDLQARLKLRDFSPRNQDIAAVELLRGCGALPYVEKNDFATAISKSRRIWASLPNAGYNQHERSLQELARYYQKALGVLADARHLVAANPVATVATGGSVALIVCAIAGCALLALK